MRWAPVLLPLLLVCAFVLGWQSPGRPDEPPLVRRGVSAEDQPVLRPGESAAAAVRFLRTLRSDPPPPPPPPPPPAPPPPPPPPPPPDVAVIFKQALGGIERDAATGALSALVRDPAASGPQIRSMAVGDRFGDGWRISEISETAVTLKKGRETRVVRLYG
jgi:hypothetical protein